MPNPTNREFRSTGCAYDATQTDETIDNGLCLVIPSEGVVGLAWTWPVAVTAEIGDLHGAQTGADIDRLAADAGWTASQIEHAVDTARAMGLVIDPAFAAWRDTRD